MHIDPRLNDVDDCLYRVSTKVIIVQDNRLLLVKEIPEMYWGFPGGGVDHGETIDVSLSREIEEELGVPATEVKSDLKLVHYTLGTVANHIPRMNLFFRASIPKELLKKTNEVAELGWFTKDEFMNLHMSPSYDDREKLASVVFGSK